MAKMKGPKTVYTCQSCGSQSPKWLGKCPDCGEWNSFVEERSAGPAADGRASGVAQDVAFTFVIKPEGDRIAAIRAFFDHDEALRSLA